MRQVGPFPLEFLPERWAGAGESFMAPPWRTLSVGRRSWWLPPAPSACPPLPCAGCEPALCPCRWGAQPAAAPAPSLLQTQGKTRQCHSTPCNLNTLRSDLPSFPLQDILLFIYILYIFLFSMSLVTLKMFQTRQKSVCVCVFVCLCVCVHAFVCLICIVSAPGSPERGSNKCLLLLIIILWRCSEMRVLTALKKRAGFLSFRFR